jgi:hypothetical protein
MKTSIIIVVIFGLLAAGCGSPYVSLTETNKEQIEDKIIDFQKEEAQGAEVTLLLKDGEEINGELLSVRDSTITMCTKYSATEKELASLQYPIHTVRTDKIWEITLEGSNYIWTGLGIGAVPGIGLGILVGVNYESKSSSGKLEGLSEGIAGCFLGIMVFTAVAALGGVIGLIASTDDVILYEIPPGYKLLPLKSLARYPDEEPEYLRAIE